jgi:hypothetical protein
MIRSLLVPAVAVALACAPVSAVAGAESDAAPCAYRLSAPAVVTVSGTEMVTVTVAPGACDGATPYQSVACVQVQGNPGPGKCEQGNGTLMAQVYLSPYRPGATYVATGRGCASKGNPPQSFCTTTGPLTATL